MVGYCCVNQLEEYYGRVLLCESKLCMHMHSRVIGATMSKPLH